MPYRPDFFIIGTMWGEEGVEKSWERQDTNDYLTSVAALIGKTEHTFAVAEIPLEL